MRRSGLGEGSGYGGESNLPGMNRYGSMDDIGVGTSNRRQQLLADLDSMRGPSSPRLIVGDRLLDSVGVEESKLSQPFALTSSLSSKLQAEGLDQSSSSTTASRRRMVGFAQSAGTDVSEDPFKSRVSSKFEAARKQADDMMDDMKRDSESSVSRFRARVQARKEETASKREQIMSNNFGGFSEEDDDTAAIQLRINKIGERAKARLAQLGDDYPEIQIGSSLASRRAATNAMSSYGDEEDDSRLASRTVKITKRSVRATYDME